jgi:hypothetical protein
MPRNIYMYMTSNSVSHTQKYVRNINSWRVIRERNWSFPNLMNRAIRTRQILTSVFKYNWTHYTFKKHCNISYQDTLTHILYQLCIYCVSSRPAIYRSVRKRILYLQKLKLIKEISHRDLPGLRHRDVVGYQHFGGPCCHHLQCSEDKHMQHGPPKRWYPTTSLHSIRNQKTKTWILTAVEKWSLTITSTWNNSDVGTIRPIPRKLDQFLLTGDQVVSTYKMSETANKRTLVPASKEMGGPGTNHYSGTMGTRPDITCSSILIPT